MRLSRFHPPLRPINPSAASLEPYWSTAGYCMARLVESITGAEVLTGDVCPANCFLKSKISFSISALRDRLPTRLKFSWILQVRLSRRHREHTVNGSRTTLHRSYCKYQSVNSLSILIEIRRVCSHEFDKSSVPFVVDTRCMLV